MLSLGRSFVRTIAPRVAISGKFVNSCPLTRSLSTMDPSKIRNCAIIAHVDHGKTTLMDKLLQHCGASVESDCVMDHNEHEKERGITIMSKYTRLFYKDHCLHVVDTPGHADFGGEVERILNMVDGVILLVDASEGPMSQTKFVLSKAIAQKKPAIVVLNKIDREGHRAQEVESDIFDLFCALTTEDHLLEYPLMYASAKQGWVCKDINALPGKEGVIPLLDTILERIPAPKTAADIEKPFALGVNTIGADNFLGRIVTGRVESGKVAVGDKLKVLTREGQVSQTDGKVEKLFYMQGLQKFEVKEAFAGQIVSIAGCNGFVADTVCAPSVDTPLVTIPISPPVISMTFGPNTGPLAGKEGSKLTSAAIKDRLRKEVENNVTLNLRPSGSSETIDVQGRGELQIGILVETLRREGYEMMISPPSVLGVKGEDGITREPYEEVTVDVSPELTGMVIDGMSERKGQMTEMKDIGNRSRCVFSVPSRGMVGFRQEIINATRGNATVNSVFSHYDVVDVSDFTGLKKGKLVSMEQGKTTGYSLMTVEQRGQLFVGVGEEVYEGMVIGENSKQGDMDVNPCKAKQLTNVRSSGAEEKVNLTPPRRLTVEEIIAYMNSDEMMEVTPKSIRLRKAILDSTARAKFNKDQKGQQQKKQMIF